MSDDAEDTAEKGMIPDDVLTPAQIEEGLDQESPIPGALALRKEHSKLAAEDFVIRRGNDGLLYFLIPMDGKGNYTGMGVPPELALVLTERVAYHAAAMLGLYIERPTVATPERGN